jgi:hypothetical protein
MRVIASRTSRIAPDFRSEAREQRIHLADQLAHRLAKLILVRGAMLLEPWFVVVLRETAQKTQR